MALKQKKTIEAPTGQMHRGRIEMSNLLATGNKEARLQLPQEATSMG